MADDYLTKLEKLKNILRSTGGCAVAYSGGVDSTLLLAVAHEVLGDRCLAVIATSSTYPRREYNEAVSWVEQSGVPYVVIVSEELDIPEFGDNPPNRCYFCKRELFTKVREQAEARELMHIADGSNADDIHDHRPGMAASRELGVLSPLKESELTKHEIRQISREIYHLPTADKPAMACMSSRFPYGAQITREKLGQVERIEDLLFERGLRTIRARHHGEMLRLELGPEEVRMVQEPELKDELVRFAKAEGFIYITLDLEGFRSGSMNAVLEKGAGEANDKSV